MAQSEKRRDRVDAVKTSLQIVTAIQNLETPTITNIASHLEIPKSTAFTHIKTLEDEEYIIESDDGKFRLGLKFLEHGIHSRDKLPLYHASSPAMEQLAEETELAVWLGVEEYGKVVCIKKQMGERAVPTRGKIGRGLRMHSGAMGKAILAHLPEERIDEIIEKHGLPARTDQTITDRELLYEELESIREEGVAFNDAESMDGLRAVASPIFLDSSIQGAICVAGTRNRMNGEQFKEILPARVKDAANEIELNLTYDS